MLRKGKEKKGDMKKESSIVTKESICSTCALFCLLAFMILCTRTLIFGKLGKTVHIFFTGVFGYLAYPLVIGALYLSVMGLLDKRLVRNRKLGVCVVAALVLLSLIVHTALTYSWSLTGYVKACFLAGTTFPKTTVCGALGGLAVYVLAKFTTKIGAIVILSLLFMFTTYLCVITAKKPSVKASAPMRKEKKESYDDKPDDIPMDEPLETDSPRTESVVSTVGQRPGVSLGGDGRPSVSEGFSPFGSPTASETSEDAPYDSREFLFGGTPADNYRRNLIFDPTARVNQTPKQPMATERDSSYTPSYSGAYESSMNNSEPIRPAKVVSDYSGESSAPRYPETESVVTPRYVEEERPSVSSYESEREEPSVSPIRREESYLDLSGTESTETTSSASYEDRGRETAMEEETFSRAEEPTVEEPSREEEPYRRHDYMDLFSPSNPRVFGDEGETPRFSRMGEEETSRGFEEERSSREEVEKSNPRSERDGLNLLDDDPYTLRSDYEERTAEEPAVMETRGREEETYVEETRGRGVYEEPVKPVEEVKPVEPPKAVEEPKKEPPKPRIIKPYKRVPLDDFDCRDIEPMANQEEVEYTKENILATLEEFKITGASIASVTFGPTVTRYNVTIPRSISPKKVVALDQSIAISLHSNGVNIYPNYEDGVVSIEVPNKERQFVQLGCMLSGDTFVNAKSSSIMFTMGKDVANRKVYGDITKMIHLLVAGSSGSGKSVFLGSLIVSLIYKYSPEELRLILIDPKKTEFVLYNNLPHLMINEIITDAGKAVQSLNWAIGEMNRRYGLFEQMSRAGTYVVNLDQYNEQLEKAQRLPKIVIIIDELADLMLAAKKEMEDRIQNLTQKARAAGIHLIVATQRPSTDVITGVIKSNLPTRVAFYVATDVDSRVILDQTGAQKLLGKGDFLYTMPGVNVPVRVQSAFISPEDSQKVVNYIKNNNEAYYDEEATAYINSRGGNSGSPSDPFDSGNSGDNVDPMYIEALRYVILSNSASISMIQRKCSAGYNRAGKIIEWMEDMGYISPFDGAKARKVLITKEEFENKYGPLEK